MQNRKRDTDVQNRILGSVGEGEGGMCRGKSIETCILSRVKQITSPGWMHETSARTWCTGKTQRDRVEREVGGGSGWGTHVNPWLFHFSVWRSPLQYKKFKKKLKEKKSLLPLSCVSSGGSVVGLMATFSKRAYAIPRSAAPRAPESAAVHCWPVSPQETLKHSSVSINT